MQINTSNNKQSLRQKMAGFTIVELVVVIIVMGILAAIVVALYEGIGTRAYDVSIQSDLENAKTDLELFYKKSSQYPNTETELNSGVGFIESQGNTMTYSKKPYGYCLYGSNPEAENTFMVRSIDQKIVEGNCAPVASLLAGSASQTGNVDGSSTAARFNNGDGGSIAITPSGDLYVSDYNNGRIRKVTKDGTVSTFVGGGAGCTAGLGTAAGLGIVTGIVYDKDSKNVYFLGCSGSRLFKVTPDGNATIINSSFYWARGLAMGPDGMLYVIGTENQRIYKVNATTGAATVFAGSGTSGYANGVGAAAQFNWPWSGVFDSSGNLIVKDVRNYRLREIAPDGTVTTLSGAGTSGIGNGIASIATYYYYSPHGMTIDKATDTIYLHESNVLRSVTPLGEAAFVQPVSSGWMGTSVGAPPQALTLGSDGILYGATRTGVIKITL